MIIKGKIKKSRLAALDFFADSLLTKQLSKHIIVNVIFRRSLDVLGITTVDDYNLSGKPREFIIDINLNQTEEEILRTLAHEMVHVKQYAKGQLDDEGRHWCGEKLYNELQYHEQPWEIEAHDIGDILLMEYMERCNGRK